jgi:uncharacterized SAM-binding protein YcdF (DUF218 family)
MASHPCLTTPTVPVSISTTSPAESPAAARDAAQDAARALAPAAASHCGRAARLARGVAAAMLWTANAAFFALAVAPVFLAAFTLHGILLFAWRPAEERTLPANAPVVIVLGGGAWHSDPRIGRVSRFERGVAIVEAGHADWIHFSGGGGSPPEAERLAEMARERLPDARITFEGASQTTLQNAWFTAAELGPIPPGAILVTDATHLFRAWAAFAWTGARAVVPMPAEDFGLRDPEARMAQVWREAAGVWLNALRVLAFALAGGGPENVAILARDAP